MVEAILGQLHIFLFLHLSRSEGLPLVQLLQIMQMNHALNWNAFRGNGNEYQAESYTLRIVR